MSERDVLTVKIPSERNQDFERIADTNERFASKSDAARECLERGLDDLRQDLNNYPGAELIQEGTKLSALTAIVAALLSVGGSISAESVGLAGSAMLVFLVAHLTGQWLAATDRVGLATQPNANNGGDDE